MKKALRTYSQLLQLRGDTIHTLLQSDQGIAFALKLFLIVSLIAGLGIWFGLPAALRTPTTVERFDAAVAATRETIALVTATVESATAAIQGQIDTAVNTASSEFNRRFGGIIDQASALFDRMAGPQAQLNRLLAQTAVTADQIEAVARQATLSPEQMRQLLARARVSTAETQRLLQLAGITPGQLAAAQAAEATQAAAVTASLQPMLDQLGMSPQQLDELLANFSVTPAQLDNWIKGLSTTPEAVGRLLAQISATPARLNELATQLRAELVRMEPPLGERPSRVIRLGGAWLASPLHYASNWILFVLVLMLVAKSLGGRATLNQHLGAVALSAAPAVLFIFAYAPEMSGAIAAPTAAAIHYTGRILALLGVIWCGALLLKAIGVAHGFGLWKSAGTVVLTWVVMYIIAPLAVVLATGFLVS